MRGNSRKLVCGKNIRKSSASLHSGFAGIGSRPMFEISGKGRISQNNSGICSRII